jgi:hypothetical protein
MATASRPTSSGCIEARCNAKTQAWDEDGFGEAMVVAWAVVEKQIIGHWSFSISHLSFGYL